MKKEKLDFIIPLCVIIFILVCLCLVLFFSLKDVFLNPEKIVQVFLDKGGIILTCFFSIIGILYCFVRDFLERREQEMVCKLVHIIDLKDYDPPYRYELQFENFGRIYSYDVLEENTYQLGEYYRILLKDRKVLNVLSESSSIEEHKKMHYLRGIYFPNAGYIDFPFLIPIFCFSVLEIIAMIIILFRLFLFRLKFFNFISYILALVCFSILLYRIIRLVNYDYNKKRSDEFF